MLEGTDEAPRRRIVSKDFPVLFSVGMLAAFISVIVQLKQKHFEETYVEMEIGSIPDLTAWIFNLYHPLNLTLFILLYLSILTFFWRTQSIRSIWVLSLWMIIACPLAHAAVLIPFYKIMERIGKNTCVASPLESFYYTLVCIEGFLTAALIVCIIRACIEQFLAKSRNSRPTPP